MKQSYGMGGHGPLDECDLRPRQGGKVSVEGPAVQGQVTKSDDELSQGAQVVVNQAAATSGVTSQEASW
jgi:hypothetical protein